MNQKAKAPHATAPRTCAKPPAFRGSEPCGEGLGAAPILPDHKLLRGIGGAVDPHGLNGGFAAVDLTLVKAEDIRRHESIGVSRASPSHY